MSETPEQAYERLTDFVAENKFEVISLLAAMPAFIHSILLQIGLSKEAGSLLAFSMAEKIVKMLDDEEFAKDD